MELRLCSGIKKVGFYLTFCRPPDIVLRRGADTESLGARTLSRRFHVSNDTISTAPTADGRMSGKSLIIYCLRKLFFIPSCLLC